MSSSDSRLLCLPSKCRDFGTCSVCWAGKVCSHVLHAHGSCYQTPKDPLHCLFALSPHILTATNCKSQPLSTLPPCPASHLPYSAQMSSPPTSHKKEVPSDMTSSALSPDLLQSQGLSMCPQERTTPPPPPHHTTHSLDAVSTSAPCPLHFSFFNAPLTIPSLLAPASKHSGFFHLKKALLSCHGGLAEEDHWPGRVGSL